MKHNLSGKAEFTFIAQIFVGVTDATAHVDLKLTRNGDRDMILWPTMACLLLIALAHKVSSFLFTNNVVLILFIV